MERLQQIHVQSQNPGPAIPSATLEIAARIIREALNRILSRRDF